MDITKTFTTVLNYIKSLSSRRLSVTLLLLISVGLFLTVLFVALPSAKVLVWPRMNLVSHTANVVLVRSGATLDFAPKNTLHLIPLRTDIHRSMEFDEISKKFLGENAETNMTIVNESNEEYALLAGTRLVNQAGMIFRTKESVVVPSATVIGPGTIRVSAHAQPMDLYGEIIGDRGNVPAGLKWELPGLSLDERKVIYARNPESGTGGTSVLGTELREDDLALAKKQLEQELIKTAKVRTEEEVENMRARTSEQITVLQYDVLTTISSSGITLPEHMLGQSVKSIPMEGSLSYEVLVYSKDQLFNLLLPGLREHIEEGQELIDNSATMDGLSVHVIEYDDDMKWVKVTAELTGKQRYILSPQTVSGREFGERSREAIRGKTVRDAKRIIQNFPEVERVSVKVWPPWRMALPALSSNIVLKPM